MYDKCTDCVNKTDGGCKINSLAKDYMGDWCADKEVPCKTCGKPTQFTETVLCNNCWEVEGRIEEYLESKKGRELIREKLRSYNDFFTVEEIEHE